MSNCKYLKTKGSNPALMLMHREIDKKFGIILLCWIFYFAECVCSKEVECIFQLKRIYRTHVLVNFSRHLLWTGVFNTVWLDGARPGNTCIHPLSHGTCSHSHAVYPLPKIHLYVLKIRKNLWNHFFILKKSKKEFNKLTFGSSEVVEREIWHFQQSYKLGIYKKVL